MPPIALITDFGNEDYFVGSMKGVILSINPDAKIIDISHQIPKQNIRNAGFVLAHAAETFPKNSIFLTVVDPGVGTERQCILLRTKNEFNFIGPNNGVFTLVAEKYGSKEVREISNESLTRSTISSTFHGRDIMAPAAAHLSLGTEASRLGPKIEELKLLEIKKPKTENDQIHGEILKIDDFGNLVTNIGGDLLKDLVSPGCDLKIKIGEFESVIPFVRAFEDVSVGEKLCYMGSANLLEVAENRGDLAEKIEVEEGDELTISRG